MPLSPSCAHGRQNLHDRLGLFHSCALGCPALLFAVNPGAHPSFSRADVADQVSWPPPFSFRGRPRSGSGSGSGCPQVEPRTGALYIRSLGLSVAGAEIAQPGTKIPQVRLFLP